MREAIAFVVLFALAGVTTLGCSGRDGDRDGRGGTHSSSGGGSGGAALTCEEGVLRLRGQHGAAARDVRGSIRSYSLNQLRDPSTLQIVWSSGTLAFEWSGTQPNGRAISTSGTMRLATGDTPEDVAFGAESTVTLGDDVGTFHLAVEGGGAYDGCWNKE